MQQAEPVAQISSGSLLIALCLIHSLLLAACVCCNWKHRLANDLENHFLTYLQAVPEDPHLPERNQLLSVVWGWVVARCAYLPAGNQCSHTTTPALTFIAIVPPPDPP